MQMSSLQQEKLFLDEFFSAWVFLKSECMLWINHLYFLGAKTWSKHYLRTALAEGMPFVLSLFAKAG